jgi:predicted outer membrane protein
MSGDPPEVVIAKSGGIVIAIDEGEILLAQFAVDNSDDSDVIAFAQQMLTVHKAHAADTDALLASLGVTPAPSSVTAALADEATSGLADIASYDDIDFEYMWNQIMMHSEAFVLVGSLADLSPNDVFTNFLLDTQALLDAHRVEAESILIDL